MKTALLTATLLVGGLATASAQTATEDFDYAAGTALGNMTGGTGWAGGWNYNVGSNGLATTGNLSTPTGTPQRSSSGDRLVIDNAQTNPAEETRYERAFATPVDDVAGNELWMSWYMNLDYTNGSFATANFGFVNVDDYGATGGGGQTVMIGQTGGTGNLENRKQGGGVVQMPSTVSAQDNWIVTAIVFKGPDEFDSTYTWVNPPIGTRLTRDNADAAREMAANGPTPKVNVITGVGGKVTQQTPITLQLDDIRVGTSQADVDPSFTLPVTLAAFGAAAEGDRNVVTWAAAAEEGFAAYFLERSTSGAEGSYETLSETSPRGVTPGTLTHYAAPDDAPAPVSYYRLRLVDYDGYTEYSSVAVVKRARRGGIRVFPNPAPRDFAHVELADAAGGTLRLVDPTGRLLVERAVYGGERVALPTTHLPAGVYTVSLVGASDVESVRLVVQ